MTLFVSKLLTFSFIFFKLKKLDVCIYKIPFCKGGHNLAMQFTYNTSYIRQARVHVLCWPADYLLKVATLNYISHVVRFAITFTRLRHIFHQRLAAKSTIQYSYCQQFISLLFLWLVSKPVRHNHKCLSGLLTSKEVLPYCHPQNIRTSKITAYVVYT